MHLLNFTCPLSCPLLCRVVFPVIHPLSCPLICLVPCSAVCPPIYALLCPVICPLSCFLAVLLSVDLSCSVIRPLLAALEDLTIPLTLERAYETKHGVRRPVLHVGLARHLTRFRTGLAIIAALMIRWAQRAAPCMVVVSAGICPLLVGTSGAMEVQVFALAFGTASTMARVRDARPSQCVPHSLLGSFLGLVEVDGKELLETLPPKPLISSSVKFLKLRASYLGMICWSRSWATFLPLASAQLEMCMIKLTW